MLSGLGKLRDVHARLVNEDASWPHLRLPDDEALAAASSLASTLGEGPLAVVGQPSAIAAQRAVVDALGVRSPRWFSSPDAALAAAVAEPGTSWVVLEGPSWVDAAAEAAVAAGNRVVVAGPGEHEAPPEGWWLSDPVAGDGRFGGLGMAAAVTAAWAGVDVEGLHAGARDMGTACSRAALFENPAYTLALAAVYVDLDLGVGTPVHLGSTSRLLPLLHWNSRMWGAVLSDAVNTGGVVRHQGQAGVAGTVGDEELLQALLRGPRDKLVTIWDAADVGAFSEHAALQVRALQDLLDRERIPHLRVRLPGIDARTLGAAVLLAEHAAVVAGCFVDIDPLGLAGVEAWYTAVQRARAVDDEAPSA